MKEMIKAMVYRMNHVSFTELTRQIPGSAGQRGIFSNNDSLLLWPGVSPEFAAAVAELLRNNEIVAKLCSIMVYVADRGPLPDYPVSTKIKEYPEIHWLPVALCRA